jgi:DNA polymerase III subunit beta
MEVVCNRKVLHRGLQSVSRAVSGRSTLPILSNVLLRAGDKGLELLTSDLEIWMGYRLAAAGKGKEAGAVEVNQPGAITVPAKLLSEVVASLPEATVQLTASESGELELVCGASRYEIRGLPAEEFPAFPEVGEEAAFGLRQDLLRDLIQKTIFATSTDETRAILTGALLVVEDNKIRMVATDSYRLSMKGTELEQESAAEINVIIPARALRELSRFLDHGDSRIEVKVGASQILFRLASTDVEQPGEVSIVSRLVEGQFPNYEKVVPKEHERRISVNREDFLATIKRCAIMARAEANKLIFDPVGSRMKVYAESADYGKAEEELPINLEGEGIKIAFNGEYLQDALESMSSEAVWLELTGSLNPGRLRPSDDPDHICVVAPVQVL